MGKSQVKTRNLPLYDYYVNLQEEFVIVELRRKIYYKRNDKVYFDKLLKFKKEKIDDISLRNSIKSIFTSKDVHDKYYSRVYGHQGYPNFLYRNEEDRNTFEQNDFINYYKIDSDVKVAVENDVLIGKVINISFEKQAVLVDIEGDKKEYSIKEVTRIL